VTPEVEARIAACVPLAPLHNPANLAAIRALAGLAPGLPHYASFDTAFHAHQPQVARRYAIPEGPQTQGLRRYGFHGISYAALVQAWLRQTGTPLPQRVLAFHLGNGASICAIADGVSVATTMGYSPVSGLTMGTRAGDIDAAAVLTLARRLGIDGAEAMLTRQSGLLGLSGLSPDMRARAEATGNAGAAFAIDHFVYWAARHAGSLAAALGGVDALAFTGGIGENAHDIRARITGALAWLAPRQTVVIPAEEEGFIARQTAALVLSPTP
jgi:acetate kinase